MKTESKKSVQTMGTGTGGGVSGNDAAHSRDSWLASRRTVEQEIAHSLRAASHAEADRVRQARRSNASGSAVAMAALGEGKGSASRALIMRGGASGEDEARQCLACYRQRIEQDGASLAHAAGQLGERFARRWLNKKSAASGRGQFSPTTREEVIAIYRGAGIAAVMAGHVNGLLGCREAIKAASKAAYSELYRSGGRDGQDTSMDEWEERHEWQGQGSMPRGESSAPDKSSGAGLRPSVVGELAAWGDQVRAACAAKIAAASTPAAKGNATAAAARRLDLIRGLFDYTQGNGGLPEELLPEFFEGGAADGPVSANGRKRLQRLREAIA